MPVVLNLSKDDYTTLMTIIKTINFSCDDLNIVKGKIFQLNNDSNIIYDIDLTDYFDDNTLRIDALKNRVGLLDIFRRQFSAVSIKLDDKIYTISDESSYIDFVHPDPAHLTNKHLKRESTNVLNFLAHDENSLIFKCEIQEFLLERLNSCIKETEPDGVCVNIRNGTATVGLEAKNQVTSVKLLTIKDVCDDQLDCSILFPLGAFLIKTDSLNMEVYRNTQTPANALLKIFTTIGTAPGIGITLWGRSPIRPNLK